MTRTYFTGEPCRNGHIAPRYVGDKRCVECKREKDARHYALHGDTTRKRANARHAANREERVAQMREHHARKKADPRYQAVRQAYMTKHRDRLLDIQRERESTPEAKALKAGKKREQAHRYRAYEQKRRAAHRTPKWFGELDEFALREAAELCMLRERATGAAWEVDHMIPLLARRASGLHCAVNFQVIPTLLNRRKNNRMLLTVPCEWISQL